jgi:hypothetical protein
MRPLATTKHVKRVKPVRRHDPGRAAVMRIRELDYRFAWFDREFLDAAFCNEPRRHPHVGKPKLLRRWTCLNRIVEAATRSEARAKLKALLGLRRLPARVELMPRVAA